MTEVWKEPKMVVAGQNGRLGTKAISEDADLKHKSSDGNEHLSTELIEFETIKFFKF